MKPKQIFAIVLIIFVSGSLAYMVVKETTAKQITDKTADNIMQYEEKASVQPDDRIIVYYFHGDVRCETCRKLEAYAKETLDIYFADELAAGKIVWQVVNVEQPQNEHFIGDYKLVTKSVVLSKIRQGKELAWENLDKIWQEVGDKQDYIEYVRNSILKFVKDTKS
jgi:hypothetical protein